MFYLLLGAGVLGDALLQVVGPPAQPQEGRRGQHHDRQPKQGGPRGHEVGLLVKIFRHIELFSMNGSIYFCLYVYGYLLTLYF